MTPKQIALVQESWREVQRIAGPSARLFYSRLFMLEPSVQSMFKGDMDEQGRKLLGMIGMAVTSLSHLERLVPAVKALGIRHASYGVEPRHYAVVGAALLWTLEQGLGPAFTAEVKDAWASAYGLLSSTMQNASRQAAA